MFIDVTRYGADHAVRLAPAAVAYLAPHPQGTIVKLIGGESLHVEETPETLEAAIDKAQFGHLIAGELITTDMPEPPPPPLREVVAAETAKPVHPARAKRR